MSKLLNQEEKPIKICEVNNCKGNCHWIIMRKDQQAIWKQSYQTKEEAVAEMKMENLFTYGDIRHMFTK